MSGIDAPTARIEASNLSTLAWTFPSVKPFVNSCIGPKNFAVRSAKIPLSIMRPRKSVAYLMYGVKMVMSFCPMVRIAPSHASSRDANFVAVSPDRASSIPEYLVSIIFIKVSNTFSSCPGSRPPPLSNFMPSLANCDRLIPNIAICSLSGICPTLNLPTMFSKDFRCSSSAPNAAPRFARRGSKALVSSPIDSSPTARFANWLKVKGEGPATLRTISST